MQKNISNRQEKIFSFFEYQRKYSLQNIIILCEKHNIQVTKITIIRDLNSLIEKKYIIKKGKGRNAVYEKNPAFSLLEPTNVDKYFSYPSEQRNSKKYFSFDIFNLLKNSIFLPEEEQYLESLHQKFEKKQKRFTSPISLKKEYERILIEFSWKSSSIEGNTYTLLETELLIKENIKTKGKTSIETQMILNHKTAFNYILENTSEFKTLSLFNLESIHSLLIENLGITKNIRTTPVGITGSEYKPLDNQFQIIEALEKMFQLLSEKEIFFEKAFITLLLLSYIQSFEDGNKRTARTFSNAILLANKTCPISYKTVDEVEYKKATLLFYEQNNLSYMKKIFIDEYAKSVERYF